MLKSLLGVGVALVGVILLIKQHWFIGLVLIVLSAGLVNGAKRDTWISFGFGESGGSWGGDAGGDGGGGD